MMCGVFVVCRIVDEAHRLKNEASILSQVLRVITSKCRLLLTGTPLQVNAQLSLSIYIYVYIIYYIACCDNNIFFLL